LTASSKSYEKLYPSLAGPTLILNLPFILQADTDSSLPHTLTHTRARSTYLAQPCPASREPLHSECRRGAALACRGDADVHLMTCPALFLALPQAFVGLFKPLFPKVAPFLSKLDQLTPLTTDSSKRKAFLAEIASLLDTGFFASGGNM
ncbi:hypothetical protein EMIHUDRAFT_108860, partial [Emiliania huxleyi CCMP1516]